MVPTILKILQFHLVPVSPDAIDYNVVKHKLGSVTSSTLLRSPYQDLLNMIHTLSVKRLQQIDILQPIPCSLVDIKLTDSGNKSKSGYEVKGAKPDKVQMQLLKLRDIELTLTGLKLLLRIYFCRGSKSLGSSLGSSFGVVSRPM